MSDEWAGILDKDEEILWQGSPRARVRLEWDSAMQPFFFLFFTGFSVFWMVMASQAGGVFWMFGLLFFAVGLYNLVGVHFWKAFQRSGEHYTLSTKRAYIGRSIWGRRSLDSYPIDAGTVIKFEDNSGDGTIFFADETHGTGESRVRTPVGFVQIDDARHVYALFRKAQEGSE